MFADKPAMLLRFVYRLYGCSSRFIAFTMGSHSAQCWRGGELFSEQVIVNSEQVTDKVETILRQDDPILSNIQGELECLESVHGPFSTVCPRLQ